MAWVSKLDGRRKKSAEHILNYIEQYDSDFMWSIQPISGRIGFRAKRDGFVHEVGVWSVAATTSAQVEAARQVVREVQAAYYADSMGKRMPGSAA